MGRRGAQAGSSTSEAPTLPTASLHTASGRQRQACRQEHTLLFASIKNAVERNLLQKRRVCPGVTGLAPDQVTPAPHHEAAHLFACFFRYIVGGTQAAARLRAAVWHMSNGTLTAEEILCRYCTLVFARTGSYVETARRLQLDRRTVKSKIDSQLLEQLNAQSTARMDG
jgi:hypothetical protein